MTILLVNSSPRGDRSESLRVAEALLDAAAEAGPLLAVDRLDLFADPLPPFSADAASAKMRVIAGEDLADGGDDGDPAVAAWRTVARTVARVRAADRTDTIRIQTTHPRRADLAEARAAATARARELGASIARPPVSA
jgi:FMN-dependent NADH-azoreductase